MKPSRLTIESEGPAFKMSDFAENERQTCRAKIVGEECSDVFKGGSTRWYQEFGAKFKSWQSTINRGSISVSIGSPCSTI